MGYSGWEMGVAPTPATLCWLGVGVDVTDLSRPHPIRVCSPDWMSGVMESPSALQKNVAAER